MDTTSINLDKPLLKIKDDLLGYSSLAKSLSNAIIGHQHPDGVVIAVYGEWGAGKSTFLNFVVDCLKTKPLSQQPIVCRFNPWWFSDREQLAKRFFESLISVMYTHKFSLGSINSLVKFANIVAELPGNYGLAGKLGLKLANTFKQDDFYSVKEKLSKELLAGRKRILCVVDDVDRLLPEEILELFRLVKAVADLPYITYILSFDKSIVAKAISKTMLERQILSGIAIHKGTTEAKFILESDRKDGENFLDKIIQMPIPLPYPDSKALLGLFGTFLEKMRFEHLDQNLWRQTFWGGIDQFLTTPRKIIRFTNSLQVTYEGVRGEVNTSDFIALECLRIFCQQVYDIIKDNPDMFCGAANAHTGKGLHNFHDAWLKDIDSSIQEPIKKIVTAVFPKLSSIWGNTNFGESYYETWRKEGRACSTDNFGIYFSFSIPKQAVSQTELKAALALVSEPEELESYLLRMAQEHFNKDGPSKLVSFFDKLMEKQKDLPIEARKSLIKMLLTIGDKLVLQQDRGQGFLGIASFGTEHRISRSILWLLPDIPEPERFTFLSGLVSTAPALGIVVQLVVDFGQLRGKYGASSENNELSTIVSESQLDKLEQIALKRIEENQNNILDLPNADRVLFAWKQWSVSNLEKWLSGVLSHEDGVAKFLEALYLPGFSLLSSISRYLEPNEIRDKVVELAKRDDLTETQRVAVDKFLDELKNERFP